MKHEKIFKRDDGSSVKVLVACEMYPYRNQSPEWSFFVYAREKRKRLWLEPPGLPTRYQRRGMSIASIKAASEAVYLTVATPAEVHETMLELWEQMKPEMPATP